MKKDLDSMARVEGILKHATASFILVSHPRKTSGPQRKGPPSMDDQQDRTGGNRDGCGKLLAKARC